jgi:cytochrome c oxidase assembly protein subunit 15
MSASNGSRVGPFLVCGFAMAVAVWCAAFVAHYPALDLPPGIAGPSVLAVWLVAALAAGRAMPRPGAAKTGTLAGLLSAGITVLILLSILVRQPAGGSMPEPGTSGLSIEGVLRIPGFLALGAVIGLVGAMIGQRLPGGRPAEKPDWLARFGWVLCWAVFPLLVIGGAVTSTGSGMAIVGWPGSDGASMFLYPISLMVSDAPKFLEHSHRLFGTLAGLTTLTLAIWVVRADHRMAARRLAVILFVAVCIQGILGGYRVRLGSQDPAQDQRYLALAHGVLAQLFFAATVAQAVVLSRWGREPGAAAAGAVPSAADSAGWRRFKRLTTALLHTTIVQLLLGAAFRHFNAAGVPHAMHIAWTHAAFAVIVVVLALLAGFRLGTAADRFPAGPARILARIGRGLIIVVTVQFILGWITLWAVSGRTQEGQRWLRDLIATVHQANGAIFIALAAAAYTLVLILRPRPAPAAARPAETAT